MACWYMVFGVVKFNDFTFLYLFRPILCLNKECLDIGTFSQLIGGIRLVHTYVWSLVHRRNLFPVDHD